MGLFRTEKEFIHAVVNGDTKTVGEYLLKSAETWRDIKDNAGTPVLLLATQNSRTETALMLIDAGANVEALDKQGYHSIFSAAQVKLASVVDRIVKAGGNVNFYNINHCSAAHWAAANGDVDTLKALSTAKADFDMQRTDIGYTPLHHAVASNHYTAAEFLLQQNVRTDIPCKEGKTALAWAKEKNFAGIVKLIEDHEAVKAPGIAASAATPVGTTSGDTWTLSGTQKIIHIETMPEIARKLTTIFNFANRERTAFTENLKTGLDTQTPPESFDNIEKAALQRAIDEFRKQGGTVPDGTHDKSIDKAQPREIRL